MHGTSGGGGLIQPYQSITRATMYDEVNMSPYLPMATTAPSPYLSLLAIQTHSLAMQTITPIFLLL